MFIGSRSSSVRFTLLHLNSIRFIQVHLSSFRLIKAHSGSFIRHIWAHLGLFILSSFRLFQGHLALLRVI